MRRTKIVCTIGPASSHATTLRRMMNAGMDVARINFSHGTPAEHSAAIERVRSVAAALGKNIAILQDLSGPKVRIGVLPSGSVTLRRNDLVTFSLEPASPGTIPLPFPELIHAVHEGDRLVADDGLLVFRVVTRSSSEIVARVQVGGTLTSHKGLTAPGVPLAINAVTPKDLEDLKLGLPAGVDWVAASFVRSAEDLEPLRQCMAAQGVTKPIIAKIERMEAVRAIHSIVDAADGIMVARGDLGVEIPIDEVPEVQKHIIALCRRAGKPVITATQMLESMTHNPMPTRAEVTDVANAILDGTDAVMLSAETAVGEYPVEAVRMMARIARRTDDHVGTSSVVEEERALTRKVPAEAVAHATVEIATQLQAALIITATTSGFTARLIAKYRPRTPIVAVTPSEDTFRALAVTWGVTPVLIEPVRDTDHMMNAALAAVVRLKLAPMGSRVVLTAGVPVNVIGTTNLIRLHTLGQEP
ncbi:MAG: pyruvate kinase [Chthonomonadales bacterium]